MGYITMYELQIEPHTEKSWKEIWDELKNNPDALYALDEDGNTNNSCKWYDHEKDLVNLSKKFPEIMFILSGQGEETGDIWIKNFLNGKKQIRGATLTFPPLTRTGWK